MKVLAINGSPRGERGYTNKILQLFVEGMRDANADVHVVQLVKHKIHHCSGELACWLKTPGHCIHRDDMTELVPMFDESEGIVFATPVYVDGMTGLMKNFVDRLVPTTQPFFEIRDNRMRHPKRSDNTKQKVALVSVCGFIEMETFDPLLYHIKAICRNMDAEFAGAVFRPGAPGMESAAMLHPFKTRKIKKAIKEAGKEFATAGKIRTETSMAISQELFTREQYVKEGNKTFKKILDKLEKEEAREPFGGQNV
jgi:multimeric flavodoxin WrbA